MCMPTWRGFSRAAFRSYLWEFQDVVAEVDDVDCIQLQPSWGFQLSEAWQSRLVWKDISNRLAYLNLGLREVRIAKDYEVFFAVCQDWKDLLYVNAVKGWKDHCKTSVCFLDELWAATIPLSRHWLHLLNQFDHVVLGFSGTVKPLEETLNRRCHYVPSGVDALRWSPLPDPPKRVIDVCSIGRRWEKPHQALLDLAATNEIFYMYDTAVDAGEIRVRDYRQHRSLLAGIAKRSRCFMVAPAKVGAVEQTKGQLEVGARFFEGAAAGSIMIGQAPDCDAFRTNFNWPEAVIPVSPDGSDVVQVLDSVRSDPEHFAAISRRNAVESLKRHDWVYRWRLISTLAGLHLTPELLERERKLAELADVASDWGCSDLRSSRSAPLRNCELSHNPS